MNSQPNKRMLLIIVSAVDVLLSGFILLIYFSFVPIDISNWGVPSWIIGLVGGLWFLSALAVLVYQLKRRKQSNNLHLLTTPLLVIIFTIIT